MNRKQIWEWASARVRARIDPRIRVQVEARFWAGVAIRAGDEARLQIWDLARERVQGPICDQVREALR